MFHYSSRKSTISQSFFSCAHQIRILQTLYLSCACQESFSCSPRSDLNISPQHSLFSTICHRWQWSLWAKPQFKGPWILVLHSKHTLRRDQEPGLQSSASQKPSTTVCEPIGTISSRPVFLLPWSEAPIRQIVHQLKKLGCQSGSWQYCFLAMQRCTLLRRSSFELYPCNVVPICAWECICLLSI